jgi:prevent-host-death family protein
MGRVVSATEARIRFGELMRQVVEKQEPIIVERSGQAHVVVLSVEEYERLLRGQEQQQDWKELVTQSRERVRADLGGRPLLPPEEILQQIREERDAELMALR